MKKRQKKFYSWTGAIVIFIAFIVMAVLFMTGCGNQQLIDTTYRFDRAIISLPNGEIIDGKVQSWKDYDGDQLQVKINGKTYLVHSEDVALIAGED
jgi:hypothetical protein